MLTLPPIAITPAKYTIGRAYFQLRESYEGEIVERRRIKISPRREEEVLRLANNETLIISERAKFTLPEGVDGLLQRKSDGSLQWIEHRLLRAFYADVEAHGWPAKIADIAKAWDGQVSFRAEAPDPDGTVAPDRRGLRPPQLGGLHAVGAHWSLYQQAGTLVMPTGTGKTETMLAVLAAYVRGPLLVVVPGDILRSQTARKFMTFGLLRFLNVLAPGVPNPVLGVVTKRPHSVEDLEIFSNCNVIISTMSALSGEYAESLAPEIAHRIDTLIVDEAHHIPAAGWSSFREAFSQRKVLQFTATPFRRDGKLVDGKVLYSYPLSVAQREGYFKKITFKPVYELDTDAANHLIAASAVETLRTDLAKGFNHLMMARCASIDRATEIQKVYQEIASDLNPIVVHSETGTTDQEIARLRAGESRIVVCVNMLGEGFDLPELKIAAVHDPHKSLAILLQFTGRITRSAGQDTGDATLIANIADANVLGSLDRLYSEDADWNSLLSELSSDAAREHAELTDFLNASERLDTSADDKDLQISHQLLRPVFSTLMFHAESFNPRKFHEGVATGLNIHQVWLNREAQTLFFVSVVEPTLRWTRSREIRDRIWSLFILHYNEAQKILYLSSTDHSSSFESIAKAVGASKQIYGDDIFRTLGGIARLVFQNVGVKKHGRRNLRYAMYTGADVAEALSLSERAGSVKSNLSGTGWEHGKPVTIGCSYKGRVWSREQGAIPQFIRWADAVGIKIRDTSIDTRQIIANVLIPEEVERLPDKLVLGLEWPLEVISQSEDRIVFIKDEAEYPYYLTALTLLDYQVTSSTFTFAIRTDAPDPLVELKMHVGGADGFKVEVLSGGPITIRAGSKEFSLEDYFSDYPPLMRYVDLSELDGNLLLKPQNTEDLAIPAERLEAWDWTGVDITKESIWKDGARRPDSIQGHVAQSYIDNEFDVVFDDDAAGEVADLVCLKEYDDHIRLVLVHCKFAGAADPGERIKDVVEVCSQAVRSAKWKWKFKGLCKQLAGRERRLATAIRPTRVMRGHIADLSRFAKISRFKEIKLEILVVQPGVQKSSLTPDQASVIGSAMSYLKETVNVDLEVICSP